ncbi:MAG: Fpg/Nei family DNA glycosylase [Acidimicrobiales bacterium]
MPELPELEILCRRLGEHLRGRILERFELGSISALKTFDPSLSSYDGTRINGVERRGKYICIATDNGWIVINLARSGWVRWRERFPLARTRPGRGPLALRAKLEGGGGFDVTEMATEKRLAIWAARSLDLVEGIATLGVEPLSETFTRDRLAVLLAGETGNLKHALSRQSLIAGIGNAYSDEALHAARLSPFKAASKLSALELDRLHAGLRDVLAAAIARAADLDMDELKDGKRGGMSVHGRAGEPCPVCRDTVAEVSFSSRSLQYCPSCQTGGKRLADRRLSRLLK